MKEVTIWDILTTSDDRCMVILLDEEGERFVPISIGPAEGHALVAGLRDITVLRPLSHDLMAAIVAELGGTLREVRIERLVDYTFYADLYIEQEDGVRRLDCRPSDAMCLAARLQAPIHVANELLIKTERRDGDVLTLKKGDEVVKVDGSGIDALAARIIENAGGKPR